MAGATVGVSTAVAEMVVVVTVEGATIAGALVVADGPVDVATALAGPAVVVTGGGALAGSVVVAGSVGGAGSVVGRPRNGPVIS